MPATKTYRPPLSSSFNLSSPPGQNNVKTSMQSPLTVTDSPKLGELGGGLTMTSVGNSYIAVGSFHADSSSRHSLPAGTNFPPLKKKSQNRKSNAIDYLKDNINPSTGAMTSLYVC